MKQSPTSFGVDTNKTDFAGWKNDIKGGTQAILRNENISKTIPGGGFLVFADSE